jgi:exodeoxyribonuclease V gamma subunit
MSGTAVQPGLIILQGNRLEDLRNVTLEWLGSHPLSPMENEYMLVQSDGVAQWLKMAMAQDFTPSGDIGWGIAFGIKVLLPARFQWLAYRAVLEADQPGSVPESTPFDKQRLRWLLLKLIPSIIDQPIYKPLQTFLKDDVQQRKLWQLSEKLADLFDQYQVYRADWLTAWSNGLNEVISARAERIQLAADQTWQAQLWRELRHHVDVEQQDSHRGAVHARFIKTALNLTPDTLPKDLPRRLVVFGISSLPQQTLEALAALSSSMQIMLCMVNPCRHYWGDLVEDRDLLRSEYLRQARKPGMPAQLDDAAFHQHAHPLLAAWGKQGRDYLHLIDVHDETSHYAPLFKDAGLQIDLFDSVPATSLLAQLQDDILELRPPTESQEHWPPIDPLMDDSIVFHIAHSAQREVEILHDQLLAKFTSQPDLLPGDVIVMVPDVQTMLPYIEAVFGQHLRSDPRYMPYQIADQKRRHQAPLVIALETLLRLPVLRLRVSEISDLLSVAAIRERFGIQESDLPRLQQWIKHANIRWGLDAPHRESLDLPGMDSIHSWHYGLQRMLYGYAMGPLDADLATHDNIVPLDEVTGLDAALVGPFAQFIETLSRQLDVLNTDHTPQDWAEILHTLLISCFAPSNPDEERLMGQVVQALDNWQEECIGSSFDGLLPLDIVREAWLQQLDNGSPGQRYGGGAITFATLMPMRAIPFKQVCLVGLNDDDYPRRSSPPDFDLMALRGQYRPGDRSRRDDDRYLFLEAILAARTGLYISWQGRSQADNSELPPSVLVGQLRDQIKLCWSIINPAEADPTSHKAGQHLLDALTTTHALQPFSEQYFTAHRLPDNSGPDYVAAVSQSRLFTYSKDWARTSASQTTRPTTPAYTPPAPLSTWAPATAIDLKQLADFLGKPLDQFFRERLDVRFPEVRDETTDDETFANKRGLDNWIQTDALLQPVGLRLALDASIDLDQRLNAVSAQRRQAGEYPTGAFGILTGQELTNNLTEALDTFKTRLGEYPTAIDPAPSIDIILSPSSDAPNCSANTDNPEQQSQPIRLTDTIGKVWKKQGGQHVRLILESSAPKNDKTFNLRIIAKHWPAHLALQVAVHGAQTHIIGPGGGITLPAIPDDKAKQHLIALLHYWQIGMSYPLLMTADIAQATLSGLRDKKTTAIDIKQLHNIEDMQEMAATTNFMAAANKVLKPGSAFARQVSTAFDITQDKHFEPMLTRLYLPLFQILIDLPGDTP